VQQLPLGADTGRKGRRTGVVVRRKGKARVCGLGWCGALLLFLAPLSRAPHPCPSATAPAPPREHRLRAGCGARGGGGLLLAAGAGRQGAGQTRWAPGCPPGFPADALHAHAAHRCAPRAPPPPTPEQEAARPLRHGYDHVLAEKVLKMEEKVGRGRGRGRAGMGQSAGKGGAGSGLPQRHPLRPQLAQPAGPAMCLYRGPSFRTRTHTHAHSRTWRR
jgi:hypothetical protein